MTYRKPLGAFSALAVFIILSLAFQNCSEVNIAGRQIGNFASKGFPLLMNAPTEYPAHKRYIFLVDMSMSMVSGPCPFDVDVPENLHGKTGIFQEWDPNFPEVPGVDVNDGRAAGRDCYVVGDLGQVPIMSYQEKASNAQYDHVFLHKTFQGVDRPGYRIQWIKTWIDQLKRNTSPEVQMHSRIMLVPVTGGRSESNLLKLLNIKTPEFLTIAQAEAHLNQLESIHTQTDFRVRLDTLTRWNQYDPTLETLMGPTNIGDNLKRIYTPINADMFSIASRGELFNTSYHLFHFGDGHHTPVPAHLSKVMSYNKLCSSCNLQNRPACSTYCNELYESMKTSWGNPESNTPEAIQFNYNMVAGLPRVYGSGLFTTYLMELNPQLPNGSRYHSVANTGKTPIFQSIENSLKDESYKVNRIFVDQAQPNFRLVEDKEEIATFKMTHLYFYNPNLRVDENGEVMLDLDGDGVADADEKKAGLDHTNNRTNTYCLDAIMFNPALGKKCSSLKDAGLCSPSLDSDGDSLNECEELVLGSDPFDFDSDGDSVPDSLELIYGYNLIRSDRDWDSNNDGLANLLNFSAGLGPSPKIASVQENLKVKLGLTYLGQQDIPDILLGSVRVDSFNAQILNFPTTKFFETAKGSRKLFMIRPTGGIQSEESEIHLRHHLARPLDKSGINRMIGIMRIIDNNNQSRIFWQIFEAELKESTPNPLANIDLSAFEQLRAVDPNGETND